MTNPRKTAPLLPDDMTNPQSDLQWLDNILINFAIDLPDEKLDHRPEYYQQQEKAVSEAKSAIAAKLEDVRVETVKAYGGCTNCFGKGYATVNAQWHGYDTDTDIGSPGGYVSGGNPNAMKFCNCSRGEQLKSRLEQMKLEAKRRGGIVSIRQYMNVLRDTKELPSWDNLKAFHAGQLKAYHEIAQLTKEGV